MTDVMDILNEYSDVKEFEYIKPRAKRRGSHGSCCTCQKCGYDFDECVCLSNEIVALLIKYQIKKP